MTPEPVVLTKFCSHTILLGEMTPDDPWMTFDPNLCKQRMALVPVVLLTKFGDHSLLFEGEEAF